MELLLLTLGVLVGLFVLSGFIEIAVKRYEAPRKKVTKNRNRRV